MLKQSRTFSLVRTLSSTALRMGLDKMKPGKGNASGRLIQGLDDLKGAAMKFGQMASMLDEQLLPDGWKEALRGLQSGATPRPFSEIIPTLNQHIPDYLSLVANIETNAVHSASIGQVHRAVLKDGRSIALKVRYPGLEDSVDSDLETLRKLLKFANVLPTQGNYDSIFERIREVFLRELDFTKEASEYEHYAQHFAGSERIQIPQVILPLSSTHTLATEWVEGTSLGTWLSQISEQSQEKRNKLAETLLWLLVHELFQVGRIQSDPNPANFLLTPQGRLAMLDFGATETVPQWLRTGYLDLTRACLGGTKRDIENVSLRIGFLKEEDTSKAKDAFVAMLAIASEPFEHNTYQFKRGGLLPRIRDHAIRFVAETRFRSPPAEILFINRRISGTHMLLEQLEGLISARRLIESHL